MNKIVLLLFNLFFLTYIFAEQNIYRIKQKLNSTDSISFLPVDTVFTIICNDNLINFVNQDYFKSYLVTKTIIPPIVNRGKREIIYNSELKITLLFDKYENFSKTIEISFYPFTKIETYLTE